MSTILNFLNVATLLICANGCVPPQGAPAQTSAPKTDTTTAPSYENGENTIDTDPIPSPTPTPTQLAPEQITVEYYKRTETRAPQTGWVAKTYTSTGYCLVYQEKTYCWDDGMKTLAWTSNGNNYGPFTYSYFNLDDPTNGDWGKTSGSMTADLMTQPLGISALVSARIGPSMIDQVFTSGILIQVVCTENDGHLICPDFVVDLEQAAL